ncbi:MAG: PilZ domain-containing protein [Candidatus Omnitrophota bacterium]
MKEGNLERRRYIRMGMLLTASYTVVNKSQEYKESIAKDVSGGGVRLPLREQLSVGTLLRVQLELEKEEKKIMFDAVVIWVKPVLGAKEYSYEAGIEFINIGPVERNMINNYVQYLNRDELLKEFFT